MKELNFKEVIANIQEGEKWVCVKKQLYNIKSIEMHSGCIKFNYVNRGLEGLIIDSETKFMKEQKPVTFQEVLNSNKKCRVEHEIIENRLSGSVPTYDQILLKYYNDFKSKKFMFIHNLMGILPWILGDDDFKEVVKNGKWYLED